MATATVYCSIINKQVVVTCIWSAFNYAGWKMPHWSVPVSNFKIFCRDGGLKRDKVKDTFKEEQQKLYSKMLVGTQEDRSRSWRTCVQGNCLWNPHVHLWLNRQSATLYWCSGLGNSSSDVSSTPFAFSVTASAWHVQFALLLRVILSLLPFARIAQLKPCLC